MRMGTRANWSFGSSDQGTTTVELSLVITAFFLLSIGLVDVGRGVWAYNSISWAATHATRYAIVHGDRAASPATASSIRNFVRNKLPGLSGVEVATVWDPDNSQGSFVRVTVQYAYRPVIALFLPVTLRASSRMAISF